jgi:hypothetical protein
VKQKGNRQMAKFAVEYRGLSWALLLDDGAVELLFDKKLLRLSLLRGRQASASQQTTKPRRA